MATAKKAVSIAKKTKAPKKVSVKKVAVKKVYVPKLDHTQTLESIGAKIGTKVMLGPGLHEIVALDTSKEDPVVLKCIEPGTDLEGVVRRSLYTVSINLVK